MDALPTDLFLYVLCTRSLSRPFTFTLWTSLKESIRHYNKRFLKSEITNNVSHGKYWIHSPWVVTSSLTTGNISLLIFLLSVLKASNGNIGNIFNLV